MKCAVNGCTHKASEQSIRGFCGKHILQPATHPAINVSISKELDKAVLDMITPKSNSTSMSAKYPKYYKSIPKGMTELDIYAVCQMFNVTDAAITHSLKKLMLPGVRTGGKSRHADIKEARDTLTRWLELNPEVKDHGNGYAK